MKRFALLTALALATALFFAGCGGGAEGDESAADSSAADTSAADTTAAEPKAEKAINVDASLVRNGVLVQPVYADGVLRTTQQVDVSSKLGGELVAVRVRDGDRVRAGQLLAKIDDREYGLALEEAR
ncbi:biotin/lipoyl-binding protein, partial [bacterium]|nr:biotin/lipoyl-binding protein [bacterium]